MSKKGTILIAVFVNACLLIVLLITATTSEEEVLLESTVMMHPPTNMQMDTPLFESEETPDIKHEVPIVQNTPEKTQEPKVNLPREETKIIVEAPKVSEDSVVHQLPKINSGKKETVIAKQEEKPKVEESKPGAKNEWIEVTVRKGDTLEKIAKNHDTTVKDIIALNRLPSTFLRIGQKLKIVPRKKQIVISQTDPGAVYYTVKVGDNPWTIAMKHHLKLEDLLHLNHLDERKARRLKPGDRLRIR